MELLEGKTMRTLSQEIVLTKQEEIAELARREPKLVMASELSGSVGVQQRELVEQRIRRPRSRMP
jgi:hypothetical protein